MKYLPSLVLSSLLAASAATGCGGASSTTAGASDADRAQAARGLTESEREKIDPRLATRYERGDEPLPIRVRFAQTPSDDVLADLLLTRVGGVVVGQVSRNDLQRILARDDVEEVSYYSGAGYDTSDDLGKP